MVVCVHASPPPQESGRQLAGSQADSPRDGNTGVGIQFKTNSNSSILYVTSILKDGPSQNRGIMTGDIVAEVDGVDVLNRGEGEKPWPFEKVSPLIKGVPGSVVTIGFLRPSAPPQDEDDHLIPVSIFARAPHRHAPSAQARAARTRHNRRHCHGSVPCSEVSAVPAVRVVALCSALAEQYL